MAMTPENLLKYLAARGIHTRTTRHPPVFTVAESRALRGDLPGGHCKSLFLKDKRDRLWLVVTLQDRVVDLKEDRENRIVGTLFQSLLDRLGQLL